MAGRIRLHPEVEARIWAAVLVGCAGAAAGEIYNALSPRGVFAPVPLAAPAVTPIVPLAKPVHTPAGKITKRPVVPVVASPVIAKPRVVELAEVKGLVEKKAAKFVDARSALRFASGHIAGSVNIPSTDFDTAFGRVKTALPPDAPTVVYCESTDCDESDLVIEQLLKRGYGKLLHFKAGWQVWEDAGLPQAQGANP